MLVQPAQRVGLPTGFVQRTHQQRHEMLAQRMLGDVSFEVGDSFARPAESKQRVRAMLQRDQMELLQSRDLRPAPRFIGELAIRPAHPRPQRPVERGDPLSGISSVERHPDRTNEIVSVTTVAIQHEPIPDIGRQNGRITQTRAQPKHVRAKRRGMPPVEVLAWPQRIDQRIVRALTTRRSEQHRQ